MSRGPLRLDLLTGRVDGVRVLEVVSIRLGPEPLAPPGEAVVFVLPGAKWPRRSLLLLQTEDGPKAFWNVCRHLPVPLDGGTGALDAREGLVCKTHGAYYRVDTGVCVRGPCLGERLDSVPLEIIDGCVYAQVDLP